MSKILFQQVINIKNLLMRFYFFFCIKCLKSDRCFILVHILIPASHIKCSDVYVASGCHVEQCREDRERRKASKSFYKAIIFPTLLRLF